MTVAYAAPGKAVIWGEYAVLAGAPALVMAVDRYAAARVDLAGDQWHIASKGFESEIRLDAAELLALEPSQATGAAAAVRAVLAALGDPPLPQGLSITTDTTDFHQGSDKLGIGSSAAVCTAACAALAEVLGRAFEPSLALAAHRLLQGGAGSGLDVAAACAGGLIRFQSGTSRPATWPAGLHYRFVWVGHPSLTTDHLARFAAWRVSADPAPLDALCQAAEAAFARPGLPALRAYTERLKALDLAAGLGIYDAAHNRLDELASRAQVVYKPCGAGGGDIGIAVSDHASSLDSLLTAAAPDSYLPLNLEIAPHGVHRLSS